MGCHLTRGLIVAVVVVIIFLLDMIVRSAGIPDGAMAGGEAAAAVLAALALLRYINRERPSG